MWGAVQGHYCRCACAVDNDLIRTADGTSQCMRGTPAFQTLRLCTADQTSQTGELLELGMSYKDLLELLGDSDLEAATSGFFAY